MALFDAEITKQLRDILSLVKEEVNIIFFSQEIECTACREAGMFLQEIVALNSKLKLKRYNFEREKALADQHGVDKIPAILLLDKDNQDLGICFYGVPGGYEINSFLGAILEVSGQREALPQEVVERLGSIHQDVHIQVFISLSCPYCPNAVMVAHRLAMENKQIRADMVDVGIFPHLAVLYNVSGVPKTVINGKTELLGAQPVNAVLDAIGSLPK